MSLILMNSIDASQFNEEKEQVSCQLKISVQGMATLPKTHM
jgi:hypothetical protein